MLGLKIHVSKKEPLGKTYVPDIINQRSSSYFFAFLGAAFIK